MSALLNPPPIVMTPTPPPYPPLPPTPTPYPGYPVPHVGAPTAVGLEGVTAVADIAWIVVIGLALLFLLGLAIYLHQEGKRGH